MATRFRVVFSVVYTIGIPCFDIHTYSLALAYTTRDIIAHLRYYGIEVFLYSAAFDLIEHLLCVD